MPAWSVSVSDPKVGPEDGAAIPQLSEEESVRSQSSSDWSLSSAATKPYSFGVMVVRQVVLPEGSTGTRGTIRCASLVDQLFTAQPIWRSRVFVQYCQN